MSKHDKYFTKQQDISDCGPACLSTVVKFYGGFHSVSSLRSYSGSSKKGTSLLGLYKASTVIGLDATGYKCSLENLKNIKKPVIAHVTIESREHFIVIFSFDKKKDSFLISNPAIGIQKILIDELENIYLTQHILQLEPNKDFMKRDIRKEKISFLFNIIKPDQSLIISNILVGIIVSILGLSLSVFIQRIIDHYIPNKDISIIQTIILLLSFLLLFRVFFVIFRNILSIKQTKSLNIRLINSFFTKLLKLKIPFFDHKDTGDFTTRLNDSQQINKFVLFITEKFILYVFILLFSLCIMFFYSKKIFLISVIIIPVFVFVIFVFYKKVFFGTTKVMCDHSNVNSNYINTIQAIELIKSEQIEEMIIFQNQQLYTIYQNSIFDLGKIKIHFKLVTELLNSFYIILIILVGVYQIFYGSLKLGEFFALFSISNILMPSIQECVNVISPYSEAKSAFERMFEYSFSEIEKMNSEIPFNTDIKSIEINNLKFSYPNQVHLLKEINIILKTGKVYGIIGETGSGKTTLSKILERFYDYDSGDIIVNNNVKLNSIPINVWRSKLGVINQNVYLFNGTVLENISLSKHTESDVLDFCNKFGFSSHFKKLQYGYYTYVGENGSNLSGGQKQLISVARCLINDYDIIIFDEATSSMDRKLEDFIIQLLLKIKHNKIILIITHKLSILPKISDEIYLIQDGVIKENRTLYKL